MRIGVLCKPDVSNVNYRAISPANALQRRGYEVHVVQVSDDDRFDPAPLRRCDVVHIYRRIDRAAQALAGELSQRGIAVTWDNDDDMRLIPPGSPNYDGNDGFRGQRYFSEEVKLTRKVDLVTATSEHLVRVFGERTSAKAVRIENYLDPAQYARSRRERGRLLIGWVAGKEHHADEKALRISETLRAVMARRPDVHVETIGVRLDLPAERYRHRDFVPFVKLKEHIRRFDVAIAPLGDVPMSYARSNVKLKEYAAAGAPWLASARGPYVGMGSSEGGMLVEDGDWEQAIMAMIASPMRRMRLRRRGGAWAKSQSIDRNVDRWIAVFEEAVALAAERRARQQRTGAAGS